MRKSAVVLVGLLLAAALTAGSVMAQGIEITKASDSEISGRLASSEVQFFATEDMPDHVIVEIQLSGDKAVRAEIDYLTRQATVRSLSPITGKAIALDESDVRALDSLSEAVRLAPQQGRVGEALRRTLLFLSAYPAGETVRVSSPPRQAGQPKAISSFCGRTGQAEPCRPQPTRSSLKIASITTSARRRMGATISVSARMSGTPQ